MEYTLSFLSLISYGTELKLHRISAQQKALDVVRNQIEMRIIPFIAILFFISCNNKELDVVSVKKHIIDVTTEYNKVWETLDVEKIADFHSNETFLYYWR